MALPDASEGGARRSRLADGVVEMAISRVLQAGVMLATALVASGAALYLIRHGGQHPDYSAFRGEPPQFRYFGSTLHWAAEMHGRGLIQLGLLVLVATPVVRVTLCAVAFALQRDWVYLLITLIVLVLLGSSFGGLI